MTARKYSNRIYGSSNGYIATECGHAAKNPASKLCGKCFSAKLRKEAGPKNVRYGHLSAHLAPTEQATPNDFRWAAGFYEGEGNCNPGGTVAVSQKDIWTLNRMRALFGGSIGGRKGRIFQWQLCGARGRGFLMSIYGLLSPRRQLQVRKALGVE